MEEQILHTFSILIKRRHSGQVFTMQVDHIYSSAQIERFKVNGKAGRYVIMEKRLANNRQPWKITDGVPTGLKNQKEIEEATMAIRDIQDKLDNYLLPALNDMEQWSEQRKRKRGLQ